MRFDNRIAFVTGGGSGIGRAISIRLASEGAKTAVTDLNVEWAESTAAEIRRTHGVAEAFKLDVTNAHNVEEVMQSAWQNFSRIDLLINNAGVSTMNRLIDLSEEDWDFNMDVNAKGTFLVTRAAVRRMLKTDYETDKPKIVNVASMAGKLPGIFLVHYTASKFAVIGFTKAVALELAPFKINVNCVCPGYVETRMQERELAWEGKLSGTTPEKVKEGYLRQVPLGRLAKPEDVATIVAFLCSHDADYMTGQAINVTGGQVMF